MTRRGWMISLLLLAIIGCDDREITPQLIVLTAWPEPRRTAFEQEARERRWLSVDHWRWLIVEPGDEDWRVAELASRADLVLGVPLEVAESLRRQDRVDGDVWVFDRSKLGFLLRTGVRFRSWSDASSLDPAHPFVWDDPRHDWVSFLTAKAVLVGKDWETGYAALVQATARARRVGSRFDSGAMGVDGSSAAVAPSTGIEGPASEATVFRALPQALEYVEVMAITKTAEHRPEAQALVKVLRDDGRVVLNPPTDSAAAPSNLDYLLAELVGATLRDAQDELWPALEALDTVRDEARAATLTRFLVQAPPWPPASVLKMAARDNGAALLGTLASEIAPDGPCREWLLARWREPERPIDGELLARFGQAEGARLVRDPRFRAWLRAEWTAWARQRYRRVARASSGAVTP